MGFCQKQHQALKERMVFFLVLHFPISFKEERFNLQERGHLRPAAFRHCHWGRVPLCPDLALICRENDLKTIDEDTGRYLPPLGEGW